MGFHVMRRTHASLMNCYRAANWKLHGPTTGRGKDSTSKRPNRSIKEVPGYPPTPRFRELLSQ